MPDIERGRRPRDELVAALRATPDRLAELVRDATDADLDRASGPGEWSARTVLAHLRDDEFLVTRLRVERMLAESAPALVPFDEQAWERGRWKGADTREALVDGFRVQRRATVAILDRLADEEWRRSGHQPEIGTFDLHRWAEHILEHDEMHVAQIATALRR